MNIVGNFISAVPRRPGFDVYCLDPQPNDAIPNIVVFTITSSSGSDNTFEQRLTFRADDGFRFSRIAASRREFGSGSQQAFVFYQGYNGNLFQFRINRSGGRDRLNVDNVPATTTRNVVAPALGTSLATVLSGDDSQTVTLFYQAEDNRIYYVWQRLPGGWSIPSLVTGEPAQRLTTLSAFAWAESDPNALTIVDNICVAFNQSPGRYVVHRLRQLRPPAGRGVNPLQTSFEPVADFCGPGTRGPFAGAYVGTSVDGTSGCSPSSARGQYRFYTQLLQEPSRIWEGTVPFSQTNGLLSYSAIISGTPKLRTPARGTSITAVYDPPRRDDRPEDGSLTVIYTSPEGLLASSNVNLSPAPTSYIPRPLADGAVRPLSIPTGVYTILDPDSSVALQLDRDSRAAQLSDSDNVGNGLSHLWLVEVVDNVKGTYTLRNVASGAHFNLASDSDAETRHVVAMAASDTDSSTEQNACQWVLTSTSGGAEGVRIQHKATNLFLEPGNASVGVRSSASGGGGAAAPRTSQLPRPPTTAPKPGAGTGWTMKPVSIGHQAVQNLVDRIPNVTTGWSTNKSYWADWNYVVIPPKQWEEIWQSSGLSEYKWREELFDCDDFAVVFKGKVALWGYDNIKVPKVGVLCGMICARLRSNHNGVGHCFNFNLSPDLKRVTFFEPQAGEFRENLITKYEPTFGFW